MSDTKSDGGWAFPQIYGSSPKEGGMTLRDWFASRALVGIIAFPGTLEGDVTKHADVTAKVAYLYADAMLAERSK